MRASNDIETALYTLLTADQISASAHAVTATLGDTLPHVHVTRTGGTTSSMVIEYNQVDFDVYAADQADAMSEASDLCGWVRDLAGKKVGSTCYASEITTLPYNNPDPLHPTISRATFKAQILTRTIERSKNNA